MGTQLRRLAYHAGSLLIGAAILGVLMLAIYLIEIAEFTNRPECRVCGYDRFTWRYAEETQYRGSLLRGPHLHLVCDRCGWAFIMRTRDSQEGA